MVEALSQFIKKKKSYRRDNPIPGHFHLRQCLHSSSQPKQPSFLTIFSKTGENNHLIKRSLTDSRSKTPRLHRRHRPHTHRNLYNCSTQLLPSSKHIFITSETPLKPPTHGRGSSPTSRPRRDHHHQQASFKPVP